jgi:amidase
MGDGASDRGGRLNRRRFLLAGAAAAVAADQFGGVAKAGGPAPDVVEATIAELQAAMASGRETAVSLVRKYVARIRALDFGGPRLNSVIELNPSAEAIARRLDAERRAGHVRGPLHGIPLLVKDNIDTADAMQTAAGSLALVGRAPMRDSTVAGKLRRAGVVLLGKSNLSEWANFRSFHSSSGWSGRAGQCLNPYVLDRSPCGSSSGSAAAAAASLCAASVGTETDGSIVCPAGMNGVVGMKPSVGLTSRAGVVPISHSQDSVGPHGRTVADVATVLAALVTTVADPRDPATGPAAAAGRRFVRQWRRHLDQHGLRGARIGIPRTGVFDFVTEEVVPVFDQVVGAMERAGATIVDPADIPTMAQINAGTEELTVLVYEFKRDISAYLATRRGVALDREGFPRTLAGLIAFNQTHAARELKWFLQELFDLSQSSPFDRATYQQALAKERQLGGPEGIDAALSAHNLDALIVPTTAPAFTIDLINGDHFSFGTSSAAAIAGYPIINLPAGESFGLPIGVSLMGTRFSELELIKLASGLEAATKARRRPHFKASVGVRDDTSPHAPTPPSAATRRNAPPRQTRPPNPATQRTPLRTL